MNMMSSFFSFAQLHLPIDPPEIAREGEKRKKKERDWGSHRERKKDERLSFPSCLSGYPTLERVVPFVAFYTCIPPLLLCSLIFLNILWGMRCSKTPKKEHTPRGAAGLTTIFTTISLSLHSERRRENTSLQASVCGVKIKINKLQISS